MFRATVLGTLLLTLVSVARGLTGAVWYAAAPPAGSDSNPGTEAEPFGSIQKGIEAAAHGDTIIVAEGTYFENIKFNGKNVVLRSTDPTDRAVVEKTVINGSGAGSVVTFDGTEDEACAIAGFTIRSGGGSHGGGICGGTPARRTRATIQNNEITDSWARDCGGAVACCDGKISNNSIRRNSAEEGGGLAYCDGAIHNNTIEDNHAWGSGGGLAHCHGVIQNNVITLNEAEDGDGGGLYECDGTIKNNAIRGNWAWLLEGMGAPPDAMRTKALGTGRASAKLVPGKPLRPFGCGAGLSNCDGAILCNLIQENWAIDSGGGLSFCNGPIQSNLIAGNRAHGDGAGLHECSGIIQNNTIAENRSSRSNGGLYQCLGVIRNCIVWGNEGTDKRQLVNSGEPSYSCIQGWTAAGNNIAADPSFVAVGNWDDNQTPGNPWDDIWVEGDYRLGCGSPCIDAGDNSLVSLPGLDMDGNPRIWRGKDSWTVDMGAYEYGSFPFEITEVLETGVVALTWNSRQGDTYTVQSCPDLLNGVWDDEAIVASQGESTTWTDHNLSSSRKFYRIELRDYPLM